MNTLNDTYRAEAEELLTELEGTLLELEERPADMELVARAFRAMHTIKGSGAMFGFDRIAAFTHHLETAFDRVRSGELEVGKALIDIALGARDHIRLLLAEEHPSPELDAAGAELLERLGALTPGSPAAGVSPADTATPASTGAETNGDTAYRIRFKPAADTFAQGMDPLVLVRELKALGPCHVTTLIEDVPALEELDTARCYLSWDLILTTGKDRNAVEDVFIFVQDDWVLSIDVIEGGAIASQGNKNTVGEILVARGDATPAQISEALSQQKRIGEILTERGAVTRETVNAALAEQHAVRQLQQEQKTRENAASVKVPADRLDSLMDLVGELVISQARLSQTANGRDDPDLLAIAEELERLTTELRDTTLELRMLPIGTTFARFRRLVRDLSAELGKEIDLVTEGAETELDKTVIDRLGDPLVHLIRNSIDHGIELPEQREAAGKARHGTVRLSATHSESHVVIRIEDDGAGLDPQAIRARAVERGLLSTDTEPVDEALFELIFEPGFSTAKTVTNISGRGVGMDAVKRSIESLRGKVRIASNPGRGTAVTVELPLTLAIIEGLLVQVAGGRYVLPLSLVEECIELTGAGASRTNGNRLIEVRGDLVPFLRLREWFNEDGPCPPIEQIVVTRLGENRFGFTVDQVVGQHQTVIKTLGKLYEGVEGLAGATILGDGEVALIIDAARLAQSFAAAANGVH